MEILIELVGFIVLWAAVFVGRKEDSKIKFMDINWWIVFSMMVLGVFFITNSENII